VVIFAELHEDLIVRLSRGDEHHLEREREERGERKRREKRERGERKRREKREREKDIRLIHTHLSTSRDAFPSSSPPSPSPPQSSYHKPLFSLPIRWGGRTQRHARHSTPSTKRKKEIPLSL
jgi:hypothetical protein